MPLTSQHRVKRDDAGEQEQMLGRASALINVRVGPHCVAKLFCPSERVRSFRQSATLIQESIRLDTIVAVFSSTASVR
jgi:hypothetical protein